MPGSARGWCRKHYKRWRNYGDPTVTVLARRDPVCTIEGCGQAHFSRGWCRRHYDSWRFNGDPLAAARIFGDDEARFWSKVDKGGPVPAYAPRLGPCWLWTDHPDSRGYAQFHIGDRAPMAHRVAYELLVGPIPDGLDLDHLCRVHPCVNPAHLEPVTRLVNVQRGWEARRGA